MSLLKDLEPYCFTENQLEKLRAYFEADCNATAAARKLGVNDRNVRRAVQVVKARAAKAGISPQEDRKGIAPPGFAVKGKSILHDKNGEPILTWVKTAQDQEVLLELMKEAIEALTSEVEPVEPRPLVLSGSDDLLNLFIITDFHLGMQAWGEETRGEDWDLKIAEDLLVNWFQVTIERMPLAKTAILGQIGDFLHWDGLDAITPSSGHHLDADTRFQKLVRVAIRSLRTVVQMLLDRHEHVHIKHAEGNHDLASSVWLRELFAAYYANEPRVTVDTSADPYYVYQHGDTALFFHHGHKRRYPALDSVFVAKFREIYGQVKHCYGHTGHLHHDLKETKLITLEQHRTLAAADAYASRHGWVSGRDSKGITYHKKYGEVSRCIVNPDMVRDLIEK
jgi:hypothetical protein